MDVLVFCRHGLSLRRAGILWRVQAVLRAGRLDRELARGTAPETHPLLAVRARQLTCPAYRHAIGRNLLRLTAPEPDIEDLTGALLGTDPVAARPVAIITELIADGAGPLYRRTGSAADELHAIIRQARSALREPAAIAVPGSPFKR
jgi:hypothetical protein